MSAVSIQSDYLPFEKRLHSVKSSSCAVLLNRNHAPPAALIRSGMEFPCFTISIHGQAPFACSQPSLEMAGNSILCSSLQLLRCGTTHYKLWLRRDIYREQSRYTDQNRMRNTISGRNTRSCSDGACWQHSEPENDRPVSQESGGGEREKSDGERDKMRIGHQRCSGRGCESAENQGKGTGMVPRRGGGQRMEDGRRRKDG